MRRFAARSASLGLAGLSVALALAFVALGYSCGAQQATAECAPGSICEEAAPRCVPRVHPVAWPLAGLALAGLAALAMGRAHVALLLAVPAAGVGALFGFSLGFFGVGVAWLLVGAALVHGTDRVVGASGLVAAVAPFPLLLLLLGLGAGPSMPLWLVWLVVLGPGAAWLALWGARAAFRKG